MAARPPPAPAQSPTPSGSSRPSGSNSPAAPPGGKGPEPSGAKGPAAAPGAKSPSRPPGSKSPVAPSSGKGPEPAVAKGPAAAPGVKSPSRPPGSKSPAGPPGGKGPEPVGAKGQAAAPGAKSPTPPPAGKGPEPAAAKGPAAPGAKSPSRPPGSKSPAAPPGGKGPEPAAAKGPAAAPGAKSPSRPPGSKSPAAPPGGKGPEAAAGKSPGRAATKSPAGSKPSKPPAQNASPAEAPSSPVADAPASADGVPPATAAAKKKTSTKDDVATPSPALPAGPIVPVNTVPPLASDPNKPPTSVKGILSVRLVVAADKDVIEDWRERNIQGDLPFNETVQEFVERLLQLRMKWDAGLEGLVCVDTRGSDFISLLPVPENILQVSLTPRELAWTPGHTYFVWLQRAGKFDPPPRSRSQIYKERLRNFYQYYAPEKESEVGAILTDFEGSEELLFSKLTGMYGPEPTEGQLKRKKQGVALPSPPVVGEVSDIGKTVREMQLQHLKDTGKYNLQRDEVLFNGKRPSEVVMGDPQTSRPKISGDIPHPTAGRKAQAAAPTSSVALALAGIGAIGGGGNDVVRQTLVVVLSRMNETLLTSLYYKRWFMFRSQRYHQRRVVSYLRGNFDGILRREYYNKLKAHLSSRKMRRQVQQSTQLAAKSESLVGDLATENSVLKGEVKRLRAQVEMLDNNNSRRLESLYSSSELAIAQIRTLTAENHQKDDLINKLEQRLMNVGNMMLQANDEKEQVLEATAAAKLELEEENEVLKKKIVDLEDGMAKANELLEEWKPKPQPVSCLHCEHYFQATHEIELLHKNADVLRARVQDAEREMRQLRETSNTLAVQLRGSRVGKTAVAAEIPSRSKVRSPQRSSERDIFNNNSSFDSNDGIPPPPPLPDEDDVGSVNSESSLLSDEPPPPPPPHFAQQNLSRSAAPYSVGRNPTSATQTGGGPLPTSGNGVNYTVPQANYPTHSFAQRHEPNLALSQQQVGVPQRNVSFSVRPATGGVGDQFPTVNSTTAESFQHRPPQVGTSQLESDPRQSTNAKLSLDSFFRSEEKRFDERLRMSMDRQTHNRLRTTGYSLQHATLDNTVDDRFKAIRQSILQPTMSSETSIDPSSAFSIAMQRHATTTGGHTYQDSNSSNALLSKYRVGDSQAGQRPKAVPERQSAVTNAELPASLAPRVDAAEMRRNIFAFSRF